MVRPEGFLASDRGTFTGRVASAVFLGDRRRVTVEVAGVEAPLAVDLPASRPVALGDALTLAVDLTTSALLPEETEG